MTYTQIHKLNQLLKRRSLRKITTQYYNSIPTTRTLFLLQESKYLNFSMKSMTWCSAIYKTNLMNSTQH